MDWKIVYDGKLSIPYLDSGQGRLCLTRKSETNDLILYVGSSPATPIPWEWLKKLYTAQLEWERGRPSVPLPEGWTWEYLPGGEWAAKNQYGICYVTSEGIVTTQKAPPEVVKTVLDIYFARKS